MLRKTTCLVALLVIVNLFQSSLQERVVRQWQPISGFANNQGFGVDTISQMSGYGSSGTGSGSSSGSGSGSSSGGSGSMTEDQNLITGISFDCSGKVSGFYRDTRYCDVFHACVYGKQLKTYPCPQVGDKFYFDEKTQKCEFAKNNPSGCPSNQYYQKVADPPAPTQGPSQPNNPYNPATNPPYNPATNPPYNPATNPPYNPATNPPYNPATNPPYNPATNPPYNPATNPPYNPATNPPYNPYNPNNNNNNGNGNNNNNNGNNGGSSNNNNDEPWKIYVRQREPFSCAGKADGFYPSRWCNVFYRCFGSIKTEFLCAKMVNGDRLWWVQHSTQTTVPQASAQCAFPCDTKRKCTSPGGILVENGAAVNDGIQDADRVWNSCDCNPTGTNSQVVPDNSNDQFRLPDTENNCGSVADGAPIASKYCNVFHVCVAGFRKDFECAKASNGQYDLWWNDATKRCDWPCKVQCSKPIFGGSKQASEIQSLDRQINTFECGGSGSGSGSGTGSGTGTGTGGGLNPGVGGYPKFKIVNYKRNFYY